MYHHRFYVKTLYKKRGAVGKRAEKIILLLAFAKKNLNPMFILCTFSSTAAALFQFKRGCTVMLTKREGGPASFIQMLSDTYTPPSIS